MKSLPWAPRVGAPGSGARAAPCPPPPSPPAILGAEPIGLSGRRRGSDQGGAQQTQPRTRPPECHLNAT
eukprot:6367532-Prymnesium_polylepis.1